MNTDRLQRIWSEVVEWLAVLLILFGCYALYTGDRAGAATCFAMGIAIAARVRVDRLARKLGVKL